MPLLVVFYFLLIDYLQGKKKNSPVDECLLLHKSILDVTNRPYLFLYTNIVLAILLLKVRLAFFTMPCNAGW